MTPVFSHGRLRLYLLRLLAEGPRHGYELIRLLENRFHGLYAPSAGTIYPRLARMEADGLISHSEAGGRKTYVITDAGRGELAARSAELDELEAEIRSSVADLTALAEQVEAGVRGSVRDLKRDLKRELREARTADQPWRPWREPPPGPAAAAGAGTGAPGAGGVAGDAAALLLRRAAELTADVTRLVALGRATAEELRVAVTVLDSVREQLRRILRG